MQIVISAKATLIYMVHFFDLVGGGVLTGPQAVAPCHHLRPHVTERDPLCSKGGEARGPFSWY